MKRFIVLSCLMIFIFFIFGCNSNKTSAEGAQKLYPNEVKEMKLEKKYDKTKWMLYCIHCDEQCIFDKAANISDSVTFGMLPLKFDKVELRNDTTELSFYFYYRDTIKCDYRLIRNITIDIGAAFGNNSDSILYYLRLSSVNRHWESGAESRYQNPLQPEVIKYIETNKSKLDPWFKLEAIRRGVLKVD